MATRLLFIGLWTIADREGRLEDRPKRIKAEVFPYDNNIKIEPLLTQLQEKGFISRYCVDNVSVIQITNFLKHQKPHFREKKSELPPMPENTGYNEKVVPSREKVVPSREKVVPSREKAMTSRAESGMRNDESGMMNQESGIMNPKKNPADDSDKKNSWENVVSVFSENIHPLSGEIERDMLADFYEHYGGLWVREAITTAIECSKGPPSLKYIGGILKKWGRDGFKAEKKKPGASTIDALAEMIAGCGG